MEDVEQQKQPYEESEADEKIRFQTELEFVQLLANSAYLNCIFRFTMVNNDRSRAT